LYLHIKVLQILPKTDFFSIFSKEWARRETDFSQVSGVKTTENQSDGTEKVRWENVM
jgi:hypothetical protein